MIVTVNSQLLAAELRLLAKVVPSKPAIAILSHALLSVHEGHLTLYATDLEAGISTRCPATVTMPGSTTLPVERLLAMVEQFTDGDVAIKVEKQQAVITCGNFTSRLRALPTEDFPEPPSVEGPDTTIDAVGLRDLIAKTRHAVSAEGTKYVLKGALLKRAADTCSMVATEGKQLALAVMNSVGPAFEVIVPIKALDMLTAQTHEGDLTMNVGDRHLFFTTGERLLTSRKLEGKFPAYDRIIPRDNHLTALVDRSMLAAALRRVVLASEENGAVYFNLASPTLLELTAASVGVGSAYESLPYEYQGHELKACINGNYVLAFLEAATSQMVKIELKDVKSAALLTGEENHLGVIMLMRA